jgi:hypothetical protein
MQESKKQPSSHADQVARRAFIKQAVVGTALAVPLMESFTASNMLAKAATAGSGQTFIITTIIQGSG